MKVPTDRISIPIEIRPLSEIVDLLYLVPAVEHLVATLASFASPRGHRSAVGGGEARALAMQLELPFTGGTQATDAAFAPGVLALLLNAVLWAQRWHLRLTDGGACSRIRALAPARRQPMRPGALPFLHRALVLLASLSMLPCTSAHGVAHPGGTLETLDCHSAYYSTDGVGACDWTLTGCPADDHGVGYGCCCTTLRIETTPAPHSMSFPTINATRSSWAHALTRDSPTVRRRATTNAAYSGKT